jgi:hypothetical protein
VEEVLSKINFHKSGRLKILVGGIFHILLEYRAIKLIRSRGGVTFITLFPFFLLDTSSTWDIQSVRL